MGLSKLTDIAVLSTTRYGVRDSAQCLNQGWNAWQDKTTYGAGIAMAISASGILSTESTLEKALSSAHKILTNDNGVLVLHIR